MIHFLNKIKYLIYKSKLYLETTYIYIWYLAAGMICLYKPLCSNFLNDFADESFFMTNLMIL